MAGWLLPGELNGRWSDYMTSHTHSSRWRRRRNCWTCFWDCTPPSTVTSLHKNKHIISNIPSHLTVTNGDIILPGYETTCL